MKITDDVIRVDGSEKIRGTNQYLEDIKIDNLHYARTLRSPIPRGEIIEIKYPERPEGLYIVDSSDVLEKNAVKMIDDAMPIFADGYVNYYGEPMALIVSKDKNAIIKFIEETEIVYKEYEGVFSIEAAEAKLPLIYQEDNLFSNLTYEMGDLKALESSHKS